MKSTVLMLFFCASRIIVNAQQVVVPNNLANVEGNSSTMEPFDSMSFRFQQVFDASQWSFLGGGAALITGISFRIDGISSSQVLLSFGGSSVELSTTQRGADGLSPVFADNRGANVTTVWNGPIAFGNVAQPGAMPQPWPFTGTIPITGAFYYRPSMGNLLLDVAAAGGQAFLPGALDAHSVSGDSVSWVVANAGEANSGTVNTLGLVTRFDFTVVPEPSMWLLATAGVALFFAFQRRPNKVTAPNSRPVLRSTSRVVYHLLPRHRPLSAAVGEFFRWP